jgi:hypothetical protein
MVHYESLEPLYAFPKVPNMRNMHWFDSSGWIMADFIYVEVTAAIKSKVQSALFFALSCDETTSVDNGNWRSVHAYICENWSRIPYLIALRKVCQAPNADHLT